MGTPAIWIDPDHAERAQIQAGQTLVIEGDEAKHAVRVRRVANGDTVILINGCGLRAPARVTNASRSLTVEITAADLIEPLHPQVEVFAAAPKGPRLDKMIDQLSQAGAARWHPLKTDFGVVEPRNTKLERLSRIASESAKQCERPWTMHIADHLVPLDEALHPADDTTIVVADAQGTPYQPNGAATVRLLVGPEGGFSPPERDRIAQSGAPLIALSPHVLRIETAAVIGAATIVNAERTLTVEPHTPTPTERRSNT